MTILYYGLFPTNLNLIFNINLSYVFNLIIINILFILFELFYKSQNYEKHELLQSTFHVHHGNNNQRNDNDKNFL